MTQNDDKMTTLSPHYDHDGEDMSESPEIASFLALNSSEGCIPKMMQLWSNMVKFGQLWSEYGDNLV